MSEPSSVNREATPIENEIGLVLPSIDPQGGDDVVDRYVADVERALHNLGYMRRSVRHRSDQSASEHFAVLDYHPEHWPLVRVHHPLTCTCSDAPHVACAKGMPDGFSVFPGSDQRGAR